MKKLIENQKSSNSISRKDALLKIGNYAKYGALTALGTYLLLTPKTAQACSPSDPESGF
jgi:hypothetical protein